MRDADSDKSSHALFSRIVESLVRRLVRRLRSRLKHRSELVEILRDAEGEHLIDADTESLGQGWHPIAHRHMASHT